MDMKQIRKIAAELETASNKLEAIAPLTAVYPDITIDDAYRIQMVNAENRIKTGRAVIGKKIGLTSAAMQQLLGVPEPDYGHLFDDMLVPEDVTIDAEKLLQPKIEAEIAFVLKEELKGPGVTVPGVLIATEGVMAAFEIVDSRITDWQIRIQDTVADNASSALFVLGRTMIPVKETDLRNMGMVFEKNGRIIDTAAGAAVLGHPAMAVAWLANRLAEYDISLKPGEIILSGALAKAVPFQNGDNFTATFSQLGSVSAAFGK